MDRNIERIWEERARQDEKWGEQNHDPFAWMAILMEEVGELSQAVLHARYGGPAAFTVSKEAVQVAAVAVAFLECLERGTWSWGNHAMVEDSASVTDEYHEADAEVRELPPLSPDARDPIVGMAMDRGEIDEIIDAHEECPSPSTQLVLGAARALRAEIDRVREAAKKVLDECDLPRSEYATTEWHALQGLRAALDGVGGEDE